MADKLSNILDCSQQIGRTSDAQLNISTNQSNTNTDRLWELEILADNQANPIQLNPVIPDNVLFYIIMFNFWGPGLGMSIFGILTNILNIITFLKQSLQDAVNISLLGLAISDLGSLFTIFMANICFLPPFQALDLPFVPMDFMYMWAWLHIMLTRVTAWITAYVTFERCLCIAYPLKVKVIVTPRRTVIYIVVLYVLMLASVVPVYYSAKATLVLDPIRNKTLHGISLSTDRNDIETVSFVVNNLVPTSAFVTVIVCTIILVQKLKSKAKWRRQSTGVGQADNLTDRDTKVIKMVVLISTVFILCYSPGAVVFIWVMVDPEMRIDGKHVDLLYANFSTLFHLESINASVNIFIYLRMSSRYKNSFLQTFCLCRTWSTTGKKPCHP